MTPIKAILYAAKSTYDKEDARSIQGQLRDIHRRLEKLGDREVVSEFTEDDASGYRAAEPYGSLLLRGPQERLAMQAAKSLAEDGAVELWVYHSNRLIRGDGLAASHLVEIYLWARRAGITLRAVKDDRAFDSIANAGQIGDQNHEYSENLSEVVKDGKVSQIERGQRLGGPVPDGLKMEVISWDSSGNVEKRHYIPDPSRASIIRLIFDLAAEGHGASTIARRVNQSGYRTASGRGWYCSRIQSTLRNPIYAGRHRAMIDGTEQLYEAQDVTPLVDRTVWDAIQASRAVRDRSAEGRDSRKGRSTSRFALSRLATCKRCGEIMVCKREGKPRKRDGGYLRYYQCHNKFNCTGLCDAPSVNAELVDAAIVPHLRDYLSNYADVLADINGEASRSLNELDVVIDDAKEREAKSRRAALAAQQRYHDALADGTSSEQDVRERAVIAAEQAAVAAEEEIARLTAKRAELLQHSSPNRDSSQFWRDIADAMAGRLEDVPNIRTLNEQLKTVLARVQLDTVPDESAGSGYRITIEPEHRDASMHLTQLITSDLARGIVVAHDENAVRAIVDLQRVGNANAEQLAIYHQNVQGSHE